MDSEKFILQSYLMQVRLLASEVVELANDTDTVFVQAYMSQVSDVLDRVQVRLNQEPISPELRPDTRGVEVFIGHNKNGDYL